LVVTRLLLLWHSANRATRASCRYVISDRLPFPLAGRPFHRSHPAHSTLRVPHRQVRVDVSFLLRCQGSRLPRRVQFYMWAEFPQTLRVLGVRQPHTNSPAHLVQGFAGNKNFSVAPTESSAATFPIGSSSLAVLLWFMIVISRKELLKKKHNQNHDETEACLTGSNLRNAKDSVGTNMNPTSANFYHG
jgi:hypothetical protein